MSENHPNTPVAIGEIEQGPSQIEQFLDRNQKNLIIAGIALLLIILCGLVIKGLADNKKVAAGSALTSASDATAYEGVTHTYAGTPAAGLAQIPAANALWNEGKKDAAIASLKTFLQDYADHPAYSSALVNLASKHLAMGNLQEASSYLKEAEETEDPTFSLVAKLLSAEIMTKEGKTEDSISLLNNLNALSDQELGNFKGLIENRIKSTKAPAPPEVEPAPQADPAPQETPAPQGNTPEKTPPAPSPAQPAPKKTPSPAEKTSVE